METDSDSRVEYYVETQTAGASEKKRERNGVSRTSRSKLVPSSTFGFKSQLSTLETENF
jgi:hypothetical protein